MIEVPYADFKTFVTTLSLPIQHFLLGDTYYVYAVNGNFHFYCKFDAASSDAADFTSTLLPNSNKKLIVEDNDGAQVVRIKAAKAGWTYHAKAFSFSTSKISSLDTEDSSVTISFYDSAGNPVTSPADESSIVKTSLTFFPSYSYEIIGGFLHMASVPTSDVKLKIIGVPSVPSSMGGSKVMLSNVNLKYIKEQSLHVDGRVTKFLAYPYSDLKFEFTHPAGYVVDMQVVVEVYRE